MNHLIKCSSLSSQRLPRNPTNYPHPSTAAEWTEWHNDKKRGRERDRQNGILIDMFLFTINWRKFNYTNQHEPVASPLDRVPEATGEVTKENGNWCQDRIGSTADQWTPQGTKFHFSHHYHIPSLSTSPVIVVLHFVSRSSSHTPCRSLFAFVSPSSCRRPHRLQPEVEYERRREREKNPGWGNSCILWRSC